MDGVRVSYLTGRRYDNTDTITKFGPYYTICALVFGENHFVGSRPGGDGLYALNLPTRILSIRRLITILTDTLDQPMKQKEGKETVSVGWTPADRPDFFTTHVPTAGIVIIIAIPTLKGAVLWTDAIRRYVEDSRRLDNKRKAETMTRDISRRNTESLSGTDIIDSLRNVLNGCIHDDIIISNTSPHIRTDISLGISSLDCFFKTEWEIVNESHPPEPVHNEEDGADEQPPRATDVAYTKIDGAAIQEIVAGRRSHRLISPLLFLNIHRMLPLSLMEKSEAFAAVCPASASSIFREDNTIDPARLPSGVHLYRVGRMPDFTCTFPHVPPPASAIRTALEGKTDPMLRAALQQIHSDSALIEAVLSGTPVPVTITTDSGEVFTSNVVIPHPCKMGENITEPISSGFYDMTYLKTAATVIDEIHRNKHYNPLDRRTACRDIFARCIRAMAMDVNDTPRGPRQCATWLLDSLGKIGLHFVPKKDRPCTEGAHIALQLQWLADLGAGENSVDIVMLTVICYETNMLTRDGGCHISLSSRPGMGKSHMFGKCISRIIPTIFCTGLSSMALFSKDASQFFRNSVLAIDEGDRHLKGVDEGIWKTVMGIAVSGAARFQNKDFAENKTGSNDKRPSQAPTPTTLVFLMNSELRDAIESMEKENIDGRKGIADRITTSVIPPPASMDKFVRSIMDSYLSGFTDPAIERMASKPRFFYSIVGIIELFVAHGLIHIPESLYMTEFAVRVLSLWQSKGYGGGTETRMIKSILNLAIADCIEEAVTERCIINSSNASAGPTSLDELCSIIYDISVSIVPTEQNLIRAASIILQSIETAAENANTFVMQLIACVSTSSFDTDSGEYTIRQNSLVTIASKMQIQEKQLINQLRQLSRTEVMELQPGAPPERVICEDQSKSFLVHRAYLLRGLLATINSPMDHSFLSVLTQFSNNVESGFSRVPNRFICTQPLTLDWFCDVPLFDIGEAMVAAMAMDAGTSNPEFIVHDFLVRREQLGAICAVRVTDDHMEIISIRMLQQSYFLPQQPRASASIASMLAQRPSGDYRLIVDTKYHNHFKTLVQGSRVASVLREVCKTPGVYPLRIPNTKDRRIVEYIRVSESDVTPMLPFNATRHRDMDGARVTTIIRCGTPNQTPKDIYDTCVYSRVCSHGIMLTADEQIATDYPQITEFSQDTAKEAKEFFNLRLFAKKYNTPRDCEDYATFSLHTSTRSDNIVSISDSYKKISRTACESYAAHLSIASQSPIHVLQHDAMQYDASVDDDAVV